MSSSQFSRRFDFQDFVRHLGVELKFITETKLANNTGNPNVTDFRRRIRHLVRPVNCFRSHISRTTLGGACVAGAKSRKVIGDKNNIPVELGALAYGKLES
jgi:hypothetical protein